MINKQKAEKQIQNNPFELDIISVFLTIQGEGPFTGERAVFIRLAGCNLKCPGCDTQYTEGRTIQPVSDIIYQVRQLSRPPTLVVITGGEPFRQDLSILCDNLVNMGHKVQIETNGTLAPNFKLNESVHVVCSPKTGSVSPVIAKRADCFKYVLHADEVDPNDGLPLKALHHSAKPAVAKAPPGIKIYLQPMDSKDIRQNHLNIEAVVKSCIKHGYILQLQTHKLIGVE